MDCSFFHEKYFLKLFTNYTVIDSIEQNKNIFKGGFFLKKYVMIFIISMMVFACTNFAFASYNFLFGDVKLKHDSMKRTIDVEVALSSDHLITKAILDYWWDDEIYTCEVIEKELKRPFLNVKFQLDTNEIPLDQVIYFQFTVTNQQGEVFKWDEIFLDQFDWSEITWEQIESDHVILQHKLLNKKTVVQLLEIIEDCYQGISENLKMDIDGKVKIVILNSYEHFSIEKKNISKFNDIEHFGGAYIGNKTIYTYIYDLPDISNFRRLISHEITHVFEYEGLYSKNVSPEYKPVFFKLFNEQLAQYVSMSVAWGEQVIDQIRYSVYPEEIEEKFSDFYWYYDLEVAVLFFDYLFEKYESCDLKEVINKFAKDTDFEKSYLSEEFEDYLSSRYSISVKFKKLRKIESSETFIDTDFNYSYNEQLDQIVLRLEQNMSSMKSVENDIVLWDFNEQSQLELTSNCFFERNPVWSRDNQHIYFIQLIGNEYSIVKMCLKDKHIKRLYTTTTRILNLALSPDGDRMIFVQWDDIYHSQLMLLNFVNQNVKQLTSGDTYVYSPIFWTNEEILYISRSMDQTSKVFSMNLSDLKSCPIPNTENINYIQDVKGNKCLFYTDHLFKYGLGLFDLEQLQSQVLFDKIQLAKVMFPILTDVGVLYYEGDTLDNCNQKIIPFD